MSDPVENVSLNGEWEWQLEDETLTSLLAKGVTLEAAQLVKHNALRSVYKLGGLYFKLEHPESPLRQLKSRLFPKAEAEFQTSQELKAAGVPTVECLGWGADGSRNVLVTREFQGSESVHDYFYRNFVYANGQYEDFVALLTTFLRNFFRSGFYHDDLHFGNLLYSPEMGEIVLVDLADISKEEELSVGELRRMQRSVLELREGLVEEDMLLAITGCGIAINTAGAREFFMDEVAAAAQRRLDEWGKRRRQILDGYGKFVTALIEGDEVVMLRKDALQKELITEEQWNDPAFMAKLEVRRYSCRQAEKLFLRSLFLQLCRVPHRRVAAWKSTGEVWLEPLPELRSKLKSSSGFGFFTATLAAQEIITPVEFIAQTASGKFLLTDIDELETLID